MRVTPPTPSPLTLSPTGTSFGRLPGRGSESDRVRREFPEALHALLEQGVARLADYQDAAYADLYLDRMRGVLAVDREAGGEAGGWKLTQEAARLLALWMSYEDTIRVADLKTRASRFARVRKEAAAKDGQIVVVTDYLKPSANEIADILPPAWAARLRKNAGAGRAVKLRTSDVSGFLAMRLMSAMKLLRRRSARFIEEQALIERWLGAIKRLGFAVLDAELSLEIVLCASSCAAMARPGARAARPSSRSSTPWWRTSRRWRAAPMHCGWPSARRARPRWPTRRPSPPRRRPRASRSSG
ncbi:MAG: hypothetical protein M5R42_21255 [Rhodocyclaceae bacterium]|nr:hypothetical protein [Rhodocyclaceae bacterium]